MDLEDPSPRRGWFLKQYENYTDLKPSKRGPKRKFGSTGARPQKVYWQREDDRAYYEATYGWSSCWFCRECSCCCKCHGPAADDEKLTDAAQADTDVMQKEKPDN